MNADTNSKLIKVQIIDRQQIALWGIDQLIKQDGRFHVCATATNSEDALKLAISTKPDVIILDPELGDEDGIDLISSLIKKTKAKVIVYTSSQNPMVLDQCVVKGARGVISKTEPVDALLKAIEKIHLGELWLNRNATSRILLQIAQANSPKELSLEQKKLLSLTSKEDKVTRAIQLHSEKTLKEISENLHISEHTLRNHLASIYDKLEVRNRMELYVFCGKFQKTDNPNVHPNRRSTDV
jgi:DNA-binding NarL/FixJ family response regulator